MDEYPDVPPGVLLSLQEPQLRDYPGSGTMRALCEPEGHLGGAAFLLYGVACDV